MSIEIEVSAFNNAEGKELEVGEYGAEVAKEFAEKVKILLKPGQKATSHRQEAKHVLLRTGQMWPGSGQKAMQIRTA